jgi:hypothetical protein
MFNEYVALAPRVSDAGATNSNTPRIKLERRMFCSSLYASFVWTFAGFVWATRYATPYGSPHFGLCTTDLSG